MLKVNAAEHFLGLLCSFYPHMHANYCSFICIILSDV